MPSSKNAVVLVAISFLLVILICGSISKSYVFALHNKPYTCSAEPGGKQVRCCQESLNDYTGEIMFVTCTTCDNTQPPSNCSPAEIIWTPNKLPPSTPPPSPNETHVNNLPGNIGTVQSPTTPPPSSLNAIPPPSALPSPTKQQTLTTTCPNGLLPDANGNCPLTPTTKTNQQSGLTSNNNNNPQQGHHHKGSNNQPTQTGGAGQESTVTKKHKGSKTDQGTTPPSS